MEYRPDDWEKVKEQAFAQSISNIAKGELPNLVELTVDALLVAMKKDGQSVTVQKFAGKEYNNKKGYLVFIPEDHS